MSITATPLSPLADSYVTLEEANTYFTTVRLNSPKWPSPTTQTVREMSLRMATLILDTYFDWSGNISTQEQRLRFPRSGIWDLDNRSYDYQQIPQPIKDAQCELAYYLIEKDRFAQSKLIGLGLSSAKVGPISIDVDIQKELSRQSEVIPDHVIALISHLGSLKGPGGSGGTVKLVRT